ncbi:hypothetical protein AA313_de0200938 [Arthrobotrys entomopaga]|nr:hypothetical protein AA313_de0200938 [Arthrobotrys entomopaga]
MSPTTGVATNGTINGANGAINGTTPKPITGNEMLEAAHQAKGKAISTLPDAGFDWRITLEGKVIAITGANRGIGLGIAESCLANSAKKVYSLDLLDPTEEFVALQKRFPNRLDYIHTDVTIEDSIQNAVDKIVELDGAIHGMIANAGMTKHQPALDFDRVQIEKLFNLNFFGAYFCCTIAAKKFIELGIKGSIVS